MIDIIEMMTAAKTKFSRYTFDVVKNHLRQMTDFFDWLDTPRVNKITPMHELLPLSSRKYNGFLTSVEDDTLLIKKSQEEIRSRILASWNVEETSYPKQILPESVYDDLFITENNQALETVDRLGLGVKNYTNHITKIKDKPILKAESSDSRIPVHYGKMVGIYQEGNESGEDGIRYENNDGNLIIDNKDSFWECEAVVLQEGKEGVTYIQPVIGNDIFLKATIKIIFSEPIEVNTFSIIPYNAAVSSYYKLDRIEVSDGIKSFPVVTTENFIMGETQFVFDVPETIQDRKIRSIYVTLRQESGYFMKYMLGYFRIKTNESYVDVTGKHLTQMAKQMGDNFGTNVSYYIDHIEDWILNYWIPGVNFNEKPELVKTVGDNGLLIVPSSESKRKRYTIGITDIKIGQNEYDDISEKVTLPITIPEGFNTISLEASDEGIVDYFISFDDGMTWKKIIPIGKEIQRNEDLRIIPNKFYINSDLSLKRKQNTETGEAAFVSTESETLRIRFVLRRGNNGSLPFVYSWKPVWGVH